MKKLLATGVLTLFSLSLLSAGTPRAKSYEITIVSLTKAGSVQLKPGQYKVKVEGSNAIFTDVNSSKSVTTPVKVETGDKKFDDTTVQITKDGDTNRLDEIGLGGSKTKLEF
ncbi:conserved exported hypothetical protein [Candidatus Sulfopaludibacter sp. SbA6]|nr:conserved exported hypothetical protein [Candidatus Sulfopaludibacter sp. SbA6]